MFLCSDAFCAKRAQMLLYAPALASANAKPALKLSFFQCQARSQMLQQLILIIWKKSSWNKFKQKSNCQHAKLQSFGEKGRGIGDWRWGIGDGGGVMEDGGYFRITNYEKQKAKVQKLIAKSPLYLSPPWVGKRGERIHEWRVHELRMKRKDGEWKMEDIYE